MKVDARIEDNCRRTISFLQGYSCPKLQLQETEYSEIYGEYSSQYKKNNFMLNARQDKRIAIYQTLYLSLSLRNLSSQGKLYYLRKTLSGNRINYSCRKTRFKNIIKDDGDGNKSGNKAIALGWENKTFAHA